MLVWITKYALTKGIYQIRAEDCGDGMVKQENSSWSYFHGEGKDWHRTHESAVARANEMRKNKILSMRKQITKLEKLTF